MHFIGEIETRFPLSCETEFAVSTFLPSKWSLFTVNSPINLLTAMNQQKFPSPSAHRPPVTGQGLILKCEPAF